MSLKTHTFEFGEFRLDGKEKVLLRDGKHLSITPKALQLLQILVENHGHLVERNELLNKVWADSFVEEGNLTFTIRILRKTLGDSKQNPRFIETIQRRGYRFIHEVREIEDETASESASPNFRKFLYPVAAVLILVTFIGFWYARSRNIVNAAPVLSASFASEKLSTNGKVQHAIVSPNGKNVIYTNGAPNEKQSVWLRQLDTGNNVEIIPPSDDVYYGLAFSPDGNFLYFNRSPKSVRQQDVYRVSIFGGIPNKILENTEGWMSISPDGKQISFVRCPGNNDEYCSLMIADALSGKNEQKLVSTRNPLRIGDNQFSPDGSRIAFATGQSLNKANEFSLKEIEVKTGVQRDLTAEKFFNIHHLAWLPDQSGLLITASKVQTKQFRIWQISAESGNAEPINKDSESYWRLSIDNEAKMIVATQFKQDFHLVVLNVENPANQRVLADASRVTVAPNEKIFFSSPMSGNDEIWSVNADGSEMRQLTNDAADDTSPVVSGDNKTIFFTSNRTSDSQIWRMNADGSNQMQVTNKNGGFPLYVSADGSWLFYHHGIDRTIWRVLVKGGEEQLVFNQKSSNFAFSPDGSQFAFLSGKEIKVVSAADGQPLKTFQLAEENFGSAEVYWMPDGKGIAYISSEKDEHFVLRQQPLAGEPSQKIADLGNESINSFAAAPNGKTFAIVKGGWRHDAVLLKGLR